MKYLPDFQFTPFDVALKESVDWFVEVSGPQGASLPAHCLLTFRSVTP